MDELNLVSKSLKINGLIDNRNLRIGGGVQTITGDSNLTINASQDSFQSPRVVLADLALWTTKFEKLCSRASNQAARQIRMRAHVDACHGTYSHSHIFG